jgi:hypothetical protein
MGKYWSKKHMQKLIVIFSLFFSSLIGQVFDPNAINIQPWINSTVCIGQPDSVVINDTLKKFFRPIGSGILCQSSHNKILLVTAKHLFLDSTQQWFPESLYIRFPFMRQIPSLQGQGLKLYLRKKGKVLFHCLQNHNRDLAGIKISASSNDLTFLLKIAIPYSQLNTSIYIIPGTEIYVIGYPYNTSFELEFMTYPLLRRGIVAWSSDIHDSTPSILIDATVLPGNSGGPVITKALDHYIDTLGNGVFYPSIVQPNLLGIVSSGPPLFFPIEANNQPVRFEQSPLVAKGYKNLTYIEPIKYIKELLDYMDLKEK